MPRPSNADYEMRRRCVAWDKCTVRFAPLFVQATPVPVHLQRASWLEVRTWFRRWFRREFDPSPRQELDVMCSLREVPRWEQYTLNGLRDPRTHGL